MKVLIFAPHNDDEVLGAGGTLAKLSREGHEVIVCEVTTGNKEDPYIKQVKREALNAHAVLGVSQSIFLDFPVVGVREVDTATKNRAFSEVVEKEKPNIVFIPHIGDMHIDHRETVEAAMVATRPCGRPYIKAILAYETLSETEWGMHSNGSSFIPNYWVDISDTMDTKIEAMRCYTTQLNEFPHPRSIEAIRALAELRGSSVCVRAAEAFMLVRGINLV